MQQLEQGPSHSALLQTQRYFEYNATPEGPEKMLTLFDCIAKFSFTLEWKTVETPFIDFPTSKTDIPYPAYLYCHFLLKDSTQQCNFLQLPNVEVKIHPATSRKNFQSISKPEEGGSTLFQFSCIHIHRLPDIPWHLLLQAHDLSRHALS